MVSRPRTHRSCFRGHQTGHVQTLPSSLFPSRHLPLFSHPDPLRHKQLPTHPALPFQVTRKSHFIPIPNADFAFRSSSHTHSLPFNTIVRCRRTPPKSRRYGGQTCHCQGPDRSTRLASSRSAVIDHDNCYYAHSTLISRHLPHANNFTRTTIFTSHDTRHTKKIIQSMQKKGLFLLEL